MKQWPERLKELQAHLEKNPDEMARMLGITPRTLGEFTRPEGRTPSEPIQKLVQMLEDGLRGKNLTAEAQKPPKLNLVIIHGDSSKDVGEVVVKIDALNKADDDSPKNDSGNNEFHFITVHPERDMPNALTVLQNKRVTPHFFMHCPGLPQLEESRCSYFAATASWLASAAKNNNLGHITLVANVQKFWPVAKELKSLTEVDVSFFQDPSAEPTSLDEIKSLKTLGINFISTVANRYHGRVTTLKFPGSYGFLEYVKQEPDKQDSKKSNWVSLGGNTVFFSYEHMRKQKNSMIAETHIEDLDIGDIVGFAIGMNNKGACATDVTLIHKTPEKLLNDKTNIIELLKDAIQVCADEQGWALISSIGGRISVLHPNYKEIFKLDGYEKINDPLKQYSSIFDYSHDGKGSNHRAACARLHV